MISYLKQLLGYPYATSKEDKEVAQWESVKAFGKAIDQICNDIHEEPFIVYGVTNYLDTRFFLLMNKLKEKEITLNKEQMTFLADSMRNFLDHLDEDPDGTCTYSIKHSGIYRLRVSRSIMENSYKIIQDELAKQE